MSFFRLNNGGLMVKAYHW